ncbi:TPA: YopB/SseC family type III secretion system translocon subunit [Morganella morganii]|uniref:YopB/SseC family type III secretion system translocon subunit n=1 Tax=Morganella morganii TaxID=582 RepID=A0AAN5MJH8_MORMO|nr:YopB/SseC family type III secretion system translocon subunit [Morganella morganii]
MDVSGIKTAQLITPGALSGEINETEKSKVVNQSEDTSFSEKIVEELGERYSRENSKKAKPQLNGQYTGKQRDGKTSAKRMSINELFARLSDDLMDEQIKNSGINNRINNDILKNIWSPQKESVLDRDIIKYFDMLSVRVNKLSDYYFNIINDKNKDYNDIRLFFTGGENVNFSEKNEFLVYFKNKLGIDNILKVISGHTGDCKEKTSLIKTLLDDIISLPKVNNQQWIIDPGELILLKAELNTLHSMAETLASVKECLSAAQSLVNMNNKNTVEYNHSLTVLMGKLADLRDKMAQQKLENDRELARLQQLALQKKTDADAAEITEKVNKAKRLQALFKWLGPLLIAIMAVLTALTGGLLAKALAAVIVVMTIISEIVKATGGPDIMAKIMEPVMKLVEAIQKFIKDISMAIGKFMGKSPEELKKLEKIMDIAAMVLAIVAVALLFVALSSVIGSIAGKFVGHFASKATEAAINSFFAQIKTLLINVMLTSTIINSASSVTNAVLQAQVTRLRADIELDSELLSRITELMNLIMETYTESQKELMALNEKISKCGNESFQRMKSIIQQGQLAV